MFVVEMQRKIVQVNVMEVLNMMNVVNVMETALHAQRQMLMLCIQAAQQ